MLAACAGSRGRPGGTVPGPRGSPGAQPQGPRQLSRGTPGREEASPSPPPPRPRCSRPYRDPQSARSPEMAEVQRGGAAGEPWRGAGGRGGALVPWGGARLETGANFPQVTLLRRLQRLTNRPCSSLVASGPRRMMGSWGLQFPSGFGTRLPGSQRHSLPIRC